MDHRKFDDLIKTVTATIGRRGVIRGLIAGAASAGLTLGRGQVRGQVTAAACNERRCRRRGDDYECCGGECTNVNRDERHCGRCEKRCNRDQVCRRGKCLSRT
jgi:hypothetical protein